MLTIKTIHLTYRRVKKNHLQIQNFVLCGMFQEVMIQCPMVSSLVLILHRMLLALLANCIEWFRALYDAGQ